MKKLIVILGAGILLFSGCEDRKELQEPSAEEIMAETKKANAFFDKVYDEYLDRHPMDQSYMGITKDQDKWNDISDEAEEKELAIVKANLERLKREISFGKLDEQAKLSYRLFEYNSKQKIEGFRWRFHNYPVNQLFGLHSEIPSFLINIHQVRDTAAALAYISRIRKVGPLLGQLIRNMEARVAKGIVPPGFVFDQVLSDCRNIVKGFPLEKSSEPNSVYEDFRSKIAGLSISAAEKDKLLTECGQALVNDFKPAYQKLIIYLTNLQQTAGNDDGAWKFPDGDEFYRYAIRSTTTTDMAPEEVFELGQREVSRIHDEMRKIMKKVGFKGDGLKDFFTFMREDKQFYYPNDSAGKKAYLGRTTGIIDSMRAHLDELFITKPKAGLIVKAVEPFREKSAAGAFYQEPAPDGSRPGIYYANLYSMSAMPVYEMEALAYHEAIPGHHMQLSVAQELKDIPKFRRFGNFIAYIEGWGLYSELTPKEMGFYKDPYSDFGRLSMELLRACRLVVDVGIHQKKWSRQQAIDYLMANTPNSELDCRREIDRYIVWPSQATAYKVGMYKILSLREQARKALGSKFDIREFHEVVLKYGAVPLGILEENVTTYIRSGP